MKILVLQLARLGDVYMSWPALRALRRTHPEAEIHLLTRPRFEGAVRGLEAIDQHLSLSAAHILEPLIQAEADLETAGERLDEFVLGLKEKAYDWVINFTFSPFSSYLTHALSGNGVRVSGYTRHADGFLNFADEISAYFYAQVGIGKVNRVHVADILASLLNLEFTEEDWRAPEFEFTSLDRFALPDNYVVVHIGASEAQKSLPAEKWAQLLSYFHQRKPQVPLVLIGAVSEKRIAETVLREVKSPLVFDLVGRTEMHELFPLLQNAMMLVGGDSAPIHIASLTDTATLNISVGPVNFWETGPKATHGFILRAESAQSLLAARAGEVMASLLEGVVAPELITRSRGLVSYHRQESEAESFAWRLCHAIYLGGDFPVSEDLRFYEAILRLDEANNVVVEQLQDERLRGPHTREILDGADEIIQNISRWVPDVSPIVNWYQAEKIRIPPGAGEDILRATLRVHKTLGQLLQVYIPQNEKEEEVAHGEI